MSVRPARPRPGRAARTVLALGLAIGLAACGPTIDAQLDEAQLLVAEGRPMAALPLLENVVQRRPADGPANLLLGQVLLQVGRPRGALAPLERALGDERWAVPAGLLLASAHLRDGQPRPALEAVNRILETHPEQPAALRIRATAHLQIGADEAALADARRILDVSPADPQAPILAGTALARLGRTDEAEALLTELEAEARGSDSPSRHVSACVALASFLEAGRREPERAAAVWRDCLELHPADPAVLQGASLFFDHHGDPEASIAALRRALDADPAALGVRLALAHRLAARGAPDEGERLLVEAAEQAAAAPGSAAPGVGAASAWQAVASFRVRHGDAGGAQRALERAIEHAAPEEAEALRFQRAMLLLDLGRTDEARTAAAEVEAPGLTELLEGRLLLAAGDPDAAQEVLETAVRRSPGDPRIHYWLGIAAQAHGRVDRALEAWQRALDLDPGATDAALSAARLAHGLGDHTRAVELLRQHRTERGTADHETALLEARSIAALGQEEAAIGLLESLLRRRNDAEAVALLAELIRRRDGPEAALARIEAAREAGLDLSAPGALPALRAYGLHATAAGRTDRALAAIAGARERASDTVPVDVVRASIEAAAGDAAAAEATLRAAVAGAPDDPRALANLGRWLHGRGELGEALPLLVRAHDLAPGDVESAHLAAQILSARGNVEGAEARLRAAVAASPLHVGAANDLAWLLAEAGRDLDLALRLARRAARLRPVGATLDTMGWVHLARGETAQAVEALSQAVARDPDDPGFRYRLGLALARDGRVDEARAAFREALAIGPFPESEDARAELARLER